MTVEQQNQSSTTFSKTVICTGVTSTVFAMYSKLECGPMPNLMAALPNIGGALCSTPQSLADAHY